VDLAVEESSEAEELKEARRYMKIRDIIEQRGNSLSFEFFPPKTQEAETQLFDAIKRLEIFRPSFVSVTYGAGGGTRKTTRRVVEHIMLETSLTPMPHLTCIGQSEDELKAILRDYQQLGIENILALRGDPPRETAWSPADDGHCHATDLVRLARSLDGLSIGVAVYPEGHVEAPSLETDMFYTKQKIEAGADFAITQMFFDNRFFYDFMERAEKAGIRIPVIAGIMPITDIGKMKQFCQTCGSTLPSSLVRRMETAGSPGEVARIGIDFATRQCEDLWQHGVRFFHFYTLNRAEAVTEVLHNSSLEGLLGETSEEDLTSSILVT